MIDMHCNVVVLRDFYSKCVWDFGYVPLTLVLVFFEGAMLLTATDLEDLLVKLCFDCSVNELLKVKEELTRERDETLQEVAKLREKIAETQDKEQKLEKELDDAQSKIQEVRKLVSQAI
jgi:septal ring factor EnvC (AmiA/AmiB activator)